MDDRSATLSVVAALLSEIAEGPSSRASWVLNTGDVGLLGSLDRLPAAAASAPAPRGNATIAAHVDHLRYGLELLNRWNRGEEPFADADYSASWRRAEVSEAEWEELRGELRAELGRWREALARPRELDEAGLTGVVASVVHLAYHLGAIRQIDPSTHGPPAS